MVMPKTQLLGIGFGQNGSTSNRGAITLPFDCAASAFSSSPCPMPSATSSASNAPPMRTFRFTASSLSRG